MGSLLLRAAVILWLSLGVIGGIEVKWTPADEEGPEPVSQRYREQAARLRELQEQGRAPPTPQQQRPPPQVGLFERVLINVLISGLSVKRWAVTHPKLAMSGVGAAMGAMSVRRLSKRNGLVISTRPFISVFRPPVSHLSDLLETTLPAAKRTGGLGGASSWGYEGEPPADVDEVVEEVEVGRGLRAYRFAKEMLRTHKVLDSIDELRFYESEGGEVGAFVLKPHSLWITMPVHIRRGHGKKKKKVEARREGGGGGESTTSSKMGKKKKGTKKCRKQAEAEEVEEEGEEAMIMFEEVILESLEGCPWKGELRLAVIHRPSARKGEEGSVSVQAKWLASSSSRRSMGMAAEDRAEIARALVKKAKELVVKEHEVFEIRERQRQELAEGAKAAALLKAKKERDRLLHPEPNRAQLKRRRVTLPSGGGDGGSHRWSPSADFVEARRGRGRRG